MESNMISDVIKEFKANGSFDEFRKNIFAEITSQPSFQTLTNKVEKFVLSYLKEQRKDYNLKKSDLRDDLRRKLNESFIFKNDVNELINLAIDAKIENDFKPIIEKMVQAISTNSSNENASNTGKVSEPIALTTNVIETKTMSKTIQQKLSIEDFLSKNEKQTSTIRSPNMKSELKLKSNSQSSMDEKPVSFSLVKTNSDKELRADKVIKKPSLASAVSITEKRPEKSENSQSKQFSNVSTSQSTTPKKTTTSTNSNTMNTNANKYKVNFEYFKNFSLINETPVEENDSGDQIYNFDWKLDQTNYHERLLDDISMSSVSTNDLSDLNELNETLEEVNNASSQTNK